MFEIYNAMDLPELMRRVLEVAPPSIREVFDDHKGLTDALRSGDANATATGHHPARQPGPVQPGRIRGRAGGPGGSGRTRGGVAGKARGQKAKAPEGRKC